MSQPDRRERRREIADAVVRGLSLPEACDRFGVALGHIYACLAEFYGGKKSLGQPSAVYDILAALLNTKESQSAIARRVGVSRQRVSQVYLNAKARGIEFTNRKDQ